MILSVGRLHDVALERQIMQLSGFDALSVVTTDSISKVLTDRQTEFITATHAGRLILSILGGT